MTSLLDPTDALLLDPLGPTFGARVLDLDLRTASDDEVAAVGRALTEHKVLVFPAQDLDPDSQVRLGDRLGEVTASHPVREGLDDAHPEIYELDSYDGGFADIWHTDVTFVTASAARRASSAP